MLRNLGFTDDDGPSLVLYAPLRRGLLTVSGDGPATLNSLGLLQRYDPNANGIPPAGPSVVRDLIGYLQADHALDSDGIMQPENTTLRTLSQIPGQTFLSAEAAGNARRAAEGWPVPTVPTGLNNVAPYPAAISSAMSGDNALFAQANGPARNVA